MHWCVQQTYRLILLLVIFTSAPLHVKKTTALSHFVRLRLLRGYDCDFFPTYQRQCANSYSILSFKRATTTTKKLIDCQHHKSHRSKLPIAFNSLPHFTAIS